MDEQGWISKSLYLKRVTGNEIVEKQDVINLSDNMKVVATTIIALKEEHAYDAWIYYKVWSASLKGEARKETIANHKTTIPKSEISFNF
jgi:hypothetical protein